MKIQTFLFLMMTSFGLNAQNDVSTVKVDDVTINYKGKSVKAKKLVVTSTIPMPIDSAWNNVKTSDLLIFVTKGFAKMKPTGGAFPKHWIEHDTASTRTRVFGFIPFGGMRHLYFETISDEDYIIQTREWDNGAKVWDHKIQLAPTENNATFYIDEIVIYGGKLTGLITAFAKRFYQHRQKRWQIVAKDNLIFGD